MSTKRQFWEARLDADILSSLDSDMAAYKKESHDADLLQVQYETLIELAEREMERRHGLEWWRR